MEIVQQAEVFQGKDEDDLEFAFTKVILKDDLQFYYAHTKRRSRDLQEVDPLKLKSFPIPNAQIWPEFPSHLTRAPQPPPQDCYNKGPCLWYYDEDGDDGPSKLLLREAGVCEMLRKSPHPNIAEYLGCVVEGDRIKGLCFTKYGPTLGERVKDGQPFDKASCLRDVRNGIEHLHTLGFIHCDINPSNIFSHQEHFVVGDFDSCTREGDELGLKGGTPDWSIESKIATRENDLYSLSKLEEYLSS